MAVYVVDDWWGRGQQGRPETRPGPTRSWKDLVPDPVECIWSEYGGLVLRSGEPQPFCDGFVIVHRSYFETAQELSPSREERKAELARLLTGAAKASPGLIWIVVSGGPQYEGELVERRLYFREVELDEPTDTAFQRYFLEFARSAEAGDPNFSLLEADPPHETLLQIYFAAVAAAPGQVLEFSANQWAGAKSEFLRLTAYSNGAGHHDSEAVVWLRQAEWPAGSAATDLFLERFLAAMQVVL